MGLGIVPWSCGNVEEVGGGLGGGVHRSVKSVVPTGGEVSPPPLSLNPPPPPSPCVPPERGVFRRRRQESSTSRTPLPAWDGRVGEGGRGKGGQF